MAEKITIDIEVNGKMQKATVDAKKLRGTLDDVDASTKKAGKSQDKYSTGLKGLGEQSANASKNFAKFSTGMGGFVGVYASLAAQLFAVSAAFQFLKRAGDLQTLQAGQQAYASATGVALRTLTNDIIAATDATVTFQDAAQAAAIGTAAGLSGDQLTRLGGAAKDASIILGRDVTDSFNRLVRGVTKAEPELLDELGVILRLKDATETYAAQLGKSADELTAFERSQAVANDVLAQTEEKYSRILKITGGSANAYAQLGKAFDDVLITLSGIADTVAGPIAKVLTNTPELAIASFGLLISGPLAALGISFKDIAAGARESAQAAKQNYTELSTQAKLATTDAAALKVQLMDIAKANNLQNAKSPVLQRLAQGTMSGTDKANLKKAFASAEAQYKQHGKIVSGIFAGMKVEVVREINTMFTQYELAEKKKLATTSVYVAKAKALYAGLAAGIRSVGAALATGLNFALRWLGWIGLAVTAYQILKDVLGFSTEEVDRQADAYETSTERLKALNKELANFSEIQRVLAEGNKGNPEGFGNVAKSLTQRTTQEAEDDFKAFMKLREKRVAAEKAYTDELKRVLKQRVKLNIDRAPNFDIDTASLAQLQSTRAARDYKLLPSLDVEAEGREGAAEEFFNDALKGLAGIEEGSRMSFDAFDAFRDVLVNGGTVQEFNRLRSEAIEVGAVIQAMPKNLKDAQAAVQQFTNSLAPNNQADNTLAALETQIENINKLEKSGTKFQIEVPKVEEIFDESGALVTIAPVMELDPLTGQMEQVKELVTVNGLPKELQDQRTELQKQAKAIALINTTRHNGQVRSLHLQAQLSRSVAGEDAAQRGLRELKNNTLMMDDQILAKQEEAMAIQTAVVELQDGKILPAQLRRLQVLGAELSVLVQQRLENEDRVRQEQNLLDIKSRLITLQQDNKIIQGEQALLDITTRRLNLEKQIADTRIKIARDQSSEGLANAGVNNLFANTERMQAEENLRLAQQEAAIKLPLIEQEYNNRIEAIDLEYDLLEAKREQTALELQKLAIELREEKKDTSAAQADAIATKLMAANYDKARTAAKDAALATKEASEYGLGKMVRDAERSLQSVQAMNQVLRTAADAFRTAMNDAVNAIFDSLSDKTMDLGEALKEIGRNFLQTVQEAITDKMIVSPILESLGLGEIGHSPSNPMYVQNVGPGTTPAAPGMPPILGGILGGGQLGSSEANPLYVRDICGCPEDKPGAGILNNLMKKDDKPVDPLATGNYSSESIDDMINEVAGEAGPFKKLFNSFTEKLGGIFNFDAPFLKGIGKIFTGFKDGLGGMFDGLLGGFGEMFKGIGGLFGGGGAGGGGMLSGLLSMIPGIGPILGGITGLFGFKDGGIMDSGRKVPGYATGGIANGSKMGHLAMLHGREAVVPLPNGNEIPVQMQGQGMQNNNVTVNVATDGSTSSSANSSEGANLGQVIAAAVQKELQNQKRAGGILNKHGAA